jgi:hypothetical protein
MPERTIKSRLQDCAGVTEWTQRRREANAAMHDEMPSHALTYLSTPQRSMRQF